MPRQLRERGGQVAFVDAAEAGKAACAVDQQLIPDAAARVLGEDAVFREIEDRREIGNHILGAVGDAFAFFVINDGDDVAVDGATVNRAVFVFEKDGKPLLMLLRARAGEAAPAPSFVVARPLAGLKEIHEGYALFDPVERQGAGRFIAVISQ